MAVAERRASIVWEGELRTGKGALSTGSGVLSSLPVTFPSRLESEDEGTSPEELIAAAHATCYAMVLTGALSTEGHPAESLEVSAVCTLDRNEAGLVIKSMALHAKGRIPGLDAAAFDEAAKRAEQRCPVSNALRGSLEITVTTELE